MTSLTESKPPTVSIAMPTYKGEPFIRAAIESVLQQSFQDFELIISDDNSPDGTQAIVESFEDPRIIYIRQDKNLGPEGNWNSCLSLARGKYFKLLPHDDLLRTDCLSRQVAVLDADIAEKVALVFCAREVIGPTGKLIMQRGYPQAVEGIIPASVVMRACVRRGTNLLGEPGAVLLRTSLARRIGGFDGTNPYVIDLDYWFRLLRHGDAWYCAETLAAFRVSKQQWSVVIGSGQSQDFREFITRILTIHPVSLNLLDRLLGRLTPAFNTAARLIFFQLYLR